MNWVLSAFARWPFLSLAQSDTPLPPLPPENPETQRESAPDARSESMESDMQTFTVRKGILHIEDTRDLTHAQDMEWGDRWPDFLPSELDSDDWSLKVKVEALDALQRVRNRIGVPLRVTNAYRNPKHNARVGGTKNSRHLKGDAFDIAVRTKTMGRKLVALAKEEGFTGIGQYPNRHFIHIDMRPAKSNGGGYRWSGGGGSW